MIRTAVLATADERQKRETDRITFIIVDRFGEQMSRDDVADAWPGFDTAHLAHKWARWALPAGCEYRVCDVRRPLDRNL